MSNGEQDNDKIYTIRKNDDKNLIEGNENKASYTEINHINNEQNINIQKPKLSKFLIIIISTVSVVAVAAIVIPVVLTNKDEENEGENQLKNTEITNHLIYSDSLKIDKTEIVHKENTENIINDDAEPKDNTVYLTNINKIITDKIEEEIKAFDTTIVTNNNKEQETENHSTAIPRINIEELEQKKYCVYSSLKLKCNNLEYYSEIGTDDISFEFQIEGETTQKYYCDSIKDGNLIEKIIPPEAISGNIILSIEKFNYIYEFSIDIIKEIQINLNENIVYKYGDDMITTNDLISKNKNNYSIIYSFTSPSNGIYDIELSSAIERSEISYLYADIDYDLECAIKKGRNIGELVKFSNSSRNDDYKKTIHGSFYLEENKIYYLKIAFLKSTGLHTYRINNIRLIPNENQNKNTFGMGYAIYQLDFKNEAFYPFYAYWAMKPNYIIVENEYSEFYYNQTLYDINYGVRQYKGAELTAPFITIKDGWYGYKVYFTDYYPKNANTTIFTQIFNNNRVNTWAGHLHTKGENVWMTHRSAALERLETHYDFGKIEWNKWYNIVIYFKVGQNNKGRIKVWLSQDKLKEDEPSYDSGNVDFGFGTWKDDETLDNTVTEANGKTNQILCKFGLYTWDGGDKKIRFKNITVIEYNPTDAFNIVNPTKD